MTKLEVTQEDRDALIEEVARAIHDVKGGLNYDYMDFCRDAAIAALRVMEAKLAEREDFYAGRYAERCGDVLKLRAALDDVICCGHDGQAAVEVARQALGE